MSNPEIPSKAHDSDPVIVTLDRGGLRRALRVITMWLIVVSIGYWIFQRNGHFLFLLLLAWLFSIAMSTPVGALQKRGWHRGSATGLVMLVVMIVFIAFVAGFGGIFFSQAVQLINSLPTLIQDIVSWLDSTFKLSLDSQQIIDSFNITPAQLANWAANFSGGFIGFISSIVGGIFQILTLFLFAFYFSSEGPRLRRVIGTWLNPSAQEVFVTTWDIAVEKTGGFVMSKVILATISFIVHSIFYATIGVPYWLAMGLITGVVSQFIPTIGTYLGILIPMLIAVIHQPIDALWIVIFATVWQQAENYLISPRISKLTMDIHPAVAFASVIIFANLFGPMGAVISIPLAAAIVAAIDTYGNRYELIPQLREKERQEAKEEI